MLYRHARDGRIALDHGESQPQHDAIDQIVQMQREQTLICPHRERLSEIKASFRSD
jgi:hypothetical protein